MADQILIQDRARGRSLARPRFVAIKVKRFDAWCVRVELTRERLDVSVDRRVYLRLRLSDRRSGDGDISVILRNVCRRHPPTSRSEERRVGNGCRSRLSSWALM